MQRTSCVYIDENTLGKTIVTKEKLLLSNSIAWNHFILKHYNIDSARPKV